jgi:hypothetical protein
LFLKIFISSLEIFRISCGLEILHGRIKRNEM